MVKFIVPLLIFLILWGLNVSSNPENRKSHLSRLLACLFFSGFVFLLSSCKSLLRALLWQVKIKRSHRHWQPRGPRGGEEASVELFYTNATTPPARAEFTTSCKTHFPSKLGATAKPAFIHSVDPSVNNKLNDQWAQRTSSKSPSFPFKCVIPRRRLSCNPHPPGWWMIVRVADLCSLLKKGSN